MTLRSRLLLALTLAFTVFSVAAIVAVVTQRQGLNDQIDEQLLSTPLPRVERPGVAGSGQEPAPVGGAQETVGQPISDLYLATVSPDGAVTVAVAGQRLLDMPDVAAVLADPPGNDTLQTVSGVDGVSDFRLLYAQRAGGSVLVALPLDDVQSSTRQLIYTMLVAIGLVAVVLALAWSWVSRFGLRPITEMTATADAISDGERSRRAGDYGETTEAGRLAHALNVMLDERDVDEQRLRSFVSNASHELRTPVTSMRGFIDLYAAGGFRGEGELDDVMRRMGIESARMQLLVEDLLKLSNLDEGQALQFDAFDVAEMLGDIAAGAEAAHPNREIVVTAPTDLSVRADRLRLHQAIAALVDNAMRYTDVADEVRLTASATPDGLTISVADDGPGIAPDALDRVFDRFYRADPSRARATGGSGLGLSITKAIVDAHGGSIVADSAPGEGATFTVTLPASREASTDQT